MKPSTKQWLDFAKADLINCERIYTSSRYPSDIGMIATGKPTQRDAQELYESAKSIYEATIALIAWQE